MLYKLFAISFFLMAGMYVNAQVGSGLDSGKAWKSKFVDPQSRYALPYLHCPLEIRFEPYDSVVGYMLLYYSNKKFYQKVAISYPQYHFLTYDACTWPKDIFTVYLYTQHANLLNMFHVQNPPQHGQVGNTGSCKDLRKVKKSKYKSLN